MSAICCHEEWSKPEARRRLRVQFQDAKPFPHVVIRPFLGPEGLQSVREEIQKVDATEKETDLFRFFQTQDLAPRLSKVTESDASKKQKLGASSELPALQALADVFASTEYRELIQEVTNCGELCERVDLATQVYAKGSHLLCHDDVIGTRKVSFIYYMTDPEEEWSSAEGGALELYPSEASTGPACAPSTELLPLADSLAVFLVEPGVSYHAVREVRGDRARVSLQGWLHAPSLEQTLKFQQRGLATLQQILDTRNGESAGSVSNQVEVEVGELSQDDFKALSKWIAPAYLDPKQLEAVQKQFEESSYAVLTEFLRADLAQRLAGELEAVDKVDGFQPDAEELPRPCYTSGVTDGWEMVGPPHLRRFLRFSKASPKEAALESPYRRLGCSLWELAVELFASDSFRRWLNACTGLDPKNDGRPQVRRFRPGLDYTVAARGALSDSHEADLDAILCFAMGGSEDEVSAAAMEQWASEEVGGFECYLAADEEDETIEAQEVYRGADTDGPLVNLPAVPNALCLVMRDDKTLRFLKYIGRDAPSSRADVSASYRVDAPEGSDEEGSEA